MTRPLPHASALLCASWLAAACGSNTRVIDVDGAQIDPLDPHGAPTVLVFVSSECPISNQYAPEVQRIARAFAPRGVRFFGVYPSRLDTADEIRAHVLAFGLELRALRDPERALVRRSGVSVTPSAAVFTKTGELAYAGRIDDRFASFGKSSPVAGVHDLEDALHAVLSGKRPKTGRTRAVGCAISE
jgi:thiol-disulfide isomerase/thioredoxin